MKRKYKIILSVLHVFLLLWTLYIIVPETKLYRVEASVNGNEDGQYRLHMMYNDGNNFPRVMNNEFVYNVKIKEKTNDSGNLVKIAYVWIPLKYASQDLFFVLSNN